MKFYFSLLIRPDRNSAWGAEHGSYERAEVEEERVRRLNAGESVRANTKIIATGDTVEEIEEAIAWYNARENADA